MSMMTFARRGAGMLVLVAGMMAGGSGSGWATFYDGNTLLKKCALDPGSVDLSNLSICLGYVAAISDALQGMISGRRNTIGGRSACVPSNVTIGQSVDVTVKFLQVHPDLRHFSANSLVAAALEEAFPCR